MFLTADWVVPVFDDPIRDGAVVVAGGRIRDVGPTAVFETLYPDEPRHDFPGCTITPGLVNAHTHLAMTCFKGLIEPQPFHSWIKYVPLAWRSLSGDDIAASIALGAIKSIACGVTAVGDIAYGPESVAIAADSGLGGVFYWEVLGISVDELPEFLYEAEFPITGDHACGPRVYCGLSPHAPYTSGPDLIAGTHKIARARGARFAVHVAESDAEVELLSSGTGPLADLAERLADGWKNPGRSPVRYLDALGALSGAAAIHCAKVLPVDLTPLARRAAGVVLCPRSNAYLMNGEPPAWRFEQAGIFLGLGTDSLASNSDLDLFEEARALRQMEPRFSARRLFEMMTIGGAEVLQVADEFGTLEPEKQADIAVYRVTGDDPFEALLAGAGRSTTEAVLSAGVWRVREGGPTTGVSLIERAARLATERAAIALDTPFLEL